MPTPDRGAGSGAAPSPRDGLADWLARAGRAVQNGKSLDTALPAGAAGLLGLDVLCLAAVARGGSLELLWCDPTAGLGPELDNLQYSLGDGPTWEAAYESRLLIEPDLAAADPARWPAFLPAAVHTAARAVIAAPLQLGVAAIGVLTGYRSAPGSLTKDQLVDFHRLRRALLLLLLRTALGDPVRSNGAGAGLRLYRADVHQATGFLSAELGIPASRALLLLRAHATAHDQDLSDLAHALLSRRMPPDTLDL
ncbi:ANTAR domain-containing protein [Streptomyces sp. NPDC059785]|uniref:ANTAR domain-containing protein n=1 Tax=Streptomyces sp. NPDC059785 TaxID=3346945 RepID=UPI003661BB77